MSLFIVFFSRFQNLPIFVNFPLHLSYLIACTVNKSINPNNFKNKFFFQHLALHHLLTQEKVFTEGVSTKFTCDCLLKFMVLFIKFILIDHLHVFELVIHILRILLGLFILLGFFVVLVKLWLQNCYFLFHLSTLFSHFQLLLILILTCLTLSFLTNLVFFILKELFLYFWVRLDGLVRLNRIKIFLIMLRDELIIMMNHFWRLYEFIELRKDVFRWVCLYLLLH